MQKYRLKSANATAICLPYAITIHYPASEYCDAEQRKVPAGWWLVQHDNSSEVSVHDNNQFTKLYERGEYFDGFNGFDPF